MHRAAGRATRTGTTRASGALLALCLLYAALAALPAADGSNLVLATAGGSPDWLLGPFRLVGADWTDGPLGGPLFYCGLWLALGLWGAVVWRAERVAPRAVLAAIVAMHVAFLLAPPLLSQDVFSYIAYARLDIEHELNPYEHAPIEAFGDPINQFAGSKTATSAYGPLFTLATDPLSLLDISTAFWILKLAAALGSLALAAVVWRTAERLGRDPRGPTLFVALNPLTLVHVVGGAHNEAYVVLLTMAGVLAWVAGRGAAAGAAATLAAGVKASAGLVVPFLAVAGPARRVLAGAAAASAAVVFAAYAGFGADALDALGLLSDNQERTSRWSFPYKTAELLGALLPGDRLDYRDAVRVAYVAAFAGVALWLLAKTRRGADPIQMAGWATLALLIASAWLVPWYALWLLPLAALARDRRLELATGALCAWMLVIAVPL